MINNDSFLFQILYYFKNEFNRYFGEMAMVSPYDDGFFINRLFGTKLHETKKSLSPSGFEDRNRKQKARLFRMKKTIKEPLKGLHF